MSAPLQFGPAMDLQVTPGGYAWWYIDAISDDGQTALTAIAFVGSVFSPWYFRARQNGPADPLQHAAINVSVRHRGKLIWVMNERAIVPSARSERRLQLGRGTQLFWQDGQLHWQIDEQTKPFFSRMPGRVQGELVLTPTVHHGSTSLLDAAGQHRWCAVAPHARLQVRLTRPDLRFEGNAYHDANWGDAALETAFAGWHWSRAPLRDGTAVCYDTSGLDGQRRALFRWFGKDGSTRQLEVPRTAPLPTGAWRVRRATSTDDGAAQLVQTLEDSPFYVRSLVAGQWLGERTVAVHESLDLRRFSAGWVRFLLPFRSRRERTRQQLALPRSALTSAATDPRSAAAQSMPGVLP